MDVMLCGINPCEQATDQTRGELIPQNLLLKQGKLQLGLPCFRENLPGQV